jgi:hypothetical protein
VEIAARVDRLEDALIRLAAAQQRTEEQFQALTEGQRTLAVAQQRTEERLGSLAAAQQRTEERLVELIAAQKHTDEQVSFLVSWQVGEDGRRRGEQLERQTQRGGVILFAGGEGGAAEQRWVQRWLNEMLAPLLPDQLEQLPAQANPGFADLLWRKGDKVAVVEVSTIIDESDVRRAHERAETLRRVGVDAIGVLIGDNWVHGEIRYLADVFKLAWRVGNDVSDAYIAYCRLPAPPTNGQPA